MWELKRIEKGLSGPAGKTLTSVRACAWYTGSLVRYLNWVRWPGIVTECWCSHGQSEKWPSFIPIDTIFSLIMEKLWEWEKSIPKEDNQVWYLKIKAMMRLGWCSLIGIFYIYIDWANVSKSSIQIYLFVHILIYGLKMWEIPCFFWTFIIS